MCGLNCIDIIATSSRLINYVDRYKLTDFDKLIITNHREYIVDMYLEEYFEVKQFKLNQNDSSKLNLRWSTQIEKFCKKVEKLIQSTNIINMINKYCNL